MTKIITSALCRAARGLLGWTQKELADAAHVGLNTVGNFEAGRGRLTTANQIAIQNALENAGIEFLPANSGPGVRLRKP